MSRSRFMTNLKVGQRYRFSAFVKTSNGAAPIFEDTDGKKLAHGAAEYFGWQTIDFEFTPTSEEYDINIDAGAKMSAGDFAEMDLMTIIKLEDPNA